MLFQEPPGILSQCFSALALVEIQLVQIAEHHVAFGVPAPAVLSVSKWVYSRTIQYSRMRTYL